MPLVVNYTAVLKGSRNQSATPKAVLTGSRVNNRLLIFLELHKDQLSTFFATNTVPSAFIRTMGPLHSGHPSAARGVCLVTLDLVQLNDKVSIPDSVLTDNVSDELRIDSCSTEHPEPVAFWVLSCSAFTFIQSILPSTFFPRTRPKGKRQIFIFIWIVDGPTSQQEHLAQHVLHEMLSWNSPAARSFFGLKSAGRLVHLESGLPRERRVFHVVTVWLINKYFFRWEARQRLMLSH